MTYSMDYMEQALSLAKLALGQVSPNPAVGAVVVKNDIVVGQGYTQPPGSSHAEVVALKQAGEEARGAVMYVTLEPCCLRYMWVSMKLRLERLMKPIPSSLLPVCPL